MYYWYRRTRTRTTRTLVRVSFNINSRAIQREGDVFFISAACGPKFMAGTLRRRGARSVNLTVFGHLSGCWLACRSSTADWLAEGTVDT